MSGQEPQLPAPRAEAPALGEAQRLVYQREGGGAPSQRQPPQPKSKLATRWHRFWRP